MTETLWAPTGTTLVNDLAPPHLRGRYNAMSTVTWQASSVIGPVIAGLLLGAVRAGLFIAGLTATLLVAAVLFVRLERHLTAAQNGIPSLDRPLEEVIAVPDPLPTPEHQRPADRPPPTGRAGPPRSPRPHPVGTAGARGPGEHPPRPHRAATPAR